MNFLENLLRYPRFFLSSMLGLILILISPLLEPAKSKKTKMFFGVFSIIVLLIILFNIIYLMMNPTY